MNSIPSTSLSSENWSTGMGRGPTPLTCTFSPKNDWSPKIGAIVSGHYNQIKLISCK
uniref:UDP-glycosyltransferase n=1 Tax=Solanum tuberosum TaxID=4113 RepID=M1BZV2_SOLTU